MKRRLIIPCVFGILAILLSSPVSGMNTYEYDELPELQDTNLGLGIPILKHGDELFISGHFYNSEISLELPITNSDTNNGNQNNLNNLVIRSFTNSDVLGVSGDEETHFIDLLDSADATPVGGDKISLEITTDTDHEGIYILNPVPEKRAKGHLLILPAINHPEGTDGYAVPLILTEEYGYVIPLISMPKGHLTNHHGLENEWGLEYDIGVTLNYVASNH